MALDDANAQAPSCRTTTLTGVGDIASWATAEYGGLESDYYYYHNSPNTYRFYLDNVSLSAGEYIDSIRIRLDYLLKTEGVSSPRATVDAVIEGDSFISESAEITTGDGELIRRDYVNNNPDSLITIETAASASVGQFHPYTSAEASIAVDSTAIVQVCEADNNCTLENPTISGPSSVQLPSGYQYYPIGFNHTGDAVDYYLNVVGHWSSGWYSTSADSINWGINWDNYSPGTYQICVTAQAKNAGSVCSDTKASCMNVEVTQEDVMTKLQVRSQNPSSDVYVDAVNGNIDEAAGGQRFATARNISSDSALSGDIWAEPTASNGHEFSHWEGNCLPGSSGRKCVANVQSGQTRTITAVYNEPAPAGLATVYVHSSNPSTVYISGTGNLYSGSTSYNIQRNVNLSGYLNAPATAGGNNFYEWQGCDSVSGQQCYVSTAVNSSQTVRAVYVTPGVATVSGCTDPTATNYNSSATTDDGSCTYPPSQPQYATLNIRSVNPSTINVGVNNSNNFTGYYFTPETIVRGGDSYMTGVIWADETVGDWAPGVADNTVHTFREWQGCDPLSIPLHYRGCYVYVELGQTQTVTAFYDSPPVIVYGCTDPTATNYDPNADSDDGSCVYPAASVNSFSLSDPQINFSVSPPELHVDDQPFTLIWNTSNANTVTGASSGSTQWPGNKSLSGSQAINEGSIPGSSKTITYSITAHGSGGNSSDSVTVKLIDPPSFDLSSEAETSIEGFPGSQATNDVTVTSRKYDGNVELEVRDEDIQSFKSIPCRSSVCLRLTYEITDMFIRCCEIFLTQVHHMAASVTLKP